MASCASLHLAALIHVLFLIWSVFAIGKCYNRKLDCPDDLENTPCSCKKTVDDDLEVICENGDVDQIGILLEKIPKETVIKHMRLHGNQIVELPGLKFQHLHIQHLAITRSSVQNIDPMAFFNLDNTLASLDLSGNLLQNIPTEAILRLRLLKTINLSSNLITHVLPTSFSGMTSLLNVRLEHNEITEVETFAFSGADNLTKINLSHNKLRNLQPTMFSKLPRLEELYLSQNQLDNLPEGFFQGVTTSLKRLDMGNNLFREIPPAIGTLERLETLNMKHNCLDDVSANGAFSASVGQQLHALDLSLNNLTRIPTEALTPLVELKHLHLENNSITDIAAHAFKAQSNSLKYLYLHNNRLSNISTKAFHGLKHLEFLYMSENRLTTLQEETFRPVKKSLKILDIHGNPFKCDCKLKWLSQADWPNRQIQSKKTKCREPQDTFGAEVTRMQNYPQVCESVHSEASKLQRVVTTPSSGHTITAGQLGWFFVICPFWLFVDSVLQ